MKWISVKDKLPKNDAVEVLVKHKNYSCYFIATYYDIGDRWFFRKEIGHVGTSEITHWMPLPPPPTSDKQC